MPYAVVLGEALIDLYEVGSPDRSDFKAMVGGAPLNVAAGLARLGMTTEFLGAISTDGFGERIRELLQGLGVGISACPTVDIPTTLAVTTLRDAQPEFRFYGEPPSYAMLGPEHVDERLIGAAAAVYCGSIALLRPGSLAAARRAWEVPGPLRAFDPNVRPALLDDPAKLRAVVEEFAATADVVKLSDADAQHLFDLPPGPAALHLRRIGAKAVVVTRGAAGAVATAGTDVFEVPAPAVTAVDTTGAGDATMAALIYAMLHADSRDARDTSHWRSIVEFAVRAGSLACEVAGGATAMPTLEQIR